MEILDTHRTSVGGPKNQMMFDDIKPAAYVLFGIGLILLGWLFLPTFKWWYGMWMREESYYSHGILIPIISGFIIWLKKKRLKEIPVESSAIGYLLLIPAVVVTIVSVWASAASIGGLMFPLVLIGISLVLFGRTITKELGFPLGYLYFMCVLPTFVLAAVSFRIQILSTVGGTMLLRLIGLDVYREGAMIITPNIEVLVGAPCSGFRLLISLFAFSSLLAYLMEGPLWGRASLVALTLPLSLILNSIRISLIAIVGEYMGRDAMMAFHDYSGYIVIVLALVILWLVARLVKCQKFNSTLLSS